MKYLPERDWEPYYEHTTTERSIKRDKKKFYERIKKKASKTFKYVWFEYLSDTDKESVYNRYDSAFLGIDKENSMDRILNRLVTKKILAESVSKHIKRKWIISKLIETKFAN